MYDQNCFSERELDLIMRLNGDKNDGYIWNCSMKYEIGKLAPKATYNLALNIIPTQPGLIVNKIPRQSRV